MKEIEVKILEINRSKTVKALTDLGATKIFDDEISTLFLDFPDGSISKQKDVLRLRKTQGKVELTYKKVKFSQAAKEAEETSVEVSDIEAALEILGNLGLSVVEQTQKRRISYRLDSVRFDIDRYLGSYSFIPEFMEIEGDLASIHRYAELLGYQTKDCLPWSTDEIIHYYRNKKQTQ
jgi:predicted adenylyl cyclase CyaB